MGKGIKKTHPERKGYGKRAWRKEVANKARRKQDAEQSADAPARGPEEAGPRKGRRGAR